MIEKSENEYLPPSKKIYWKQINWLLDDLVFQVSGKVSSLSSKYSHSGPLIPDALLIEISTWNFQGMLLGANNIIHDIRDNSFLQGQSDGLKAHPTALHRS